MEDAPLFTRVEVDWLNDYAPDVAWPAGDYEMKRKGE
jgi:hypothetical protein